MSIKLVSAALALTLAAGAVQAQSVNPGVEQLARSAGVDGLSIAQLIQLQEARRDNDAARIDFILSQAGAGASRAQDFDASSAPSAGLAQMEAALGVTTGRYTAAELIQLTEARKEKNDAKFAFILSGENRAAAPDASVVSPGKAQLAATLGVNAADFTLAELVAMMADLD